MDRMTALQLTIANMRRIFLSAVREGTVCAHCGAPLSESTPELDYTQEVGYGPLFCYLSHSFYCSEAERHEALGGAPFRGMPVG